MRRPIMALAKAFLGIGTALAVFPVSAQQSPPSPGGPSATTAPGSSGELTLPAINPSRGARYLLRNGWDYITYQQYDRALSFFREAESRQGELNESERLKLKQGVERALRGIREASNGMKTERAYARSGRMSTPGAIAAAPPTTTPATATAVATAVAASPEPAPAAAPEREPVQLASGRNAPVDSENVRTSAEMPTAIAFAPTAPAPAEIPPTPEVGEIKLPSLSSVGEPAMTLPTPEPSAPAPAPAPIDGPAPAPVASAPATVPDPVAPASGEIILPEPPVAAAEPIAPASGEVVLPARAPEPEPEPAPPTSSELELPPMPSVEQLPPLPPGMDQGAPEPVVTPIPLDGPPVVTLPGTSDPTTPPAPDAPPSSAGDIEPPPADPAPAAPVTAESPLDLPRASDLPRSSLTPELQREVDRIARRQEEELLQNPPRPLPGTDPTMPMEPEDLGPGAGSSTRLEISRAPSPTEARPIRAIPVPEEFVPLPKRDWQPNRKYWAAAATCHMPLYFQDAVLERYGYSMEQRFGPAGRYLSYPIDDPKQSKQRNQIVQPWFSAGLFAAQIALLPYNLIVDPPWEAEYDLGYYRPGDRVPTDVWYLPWKGVGPIGGGVGHFGSHHKGEGPAAPPTPRW